MKRYLRPINEFIAAEPAIKPKTAPPTTTPAPPRPGRPGPTKRPSEKEKEKPMAILNDIMDQFFSALDEIKDTPKGRAIIKKLHKKYVND
jgi:hypothetical protein